MALPLKADLIALPRTATHTLVQKISNKYLEKYRFFTEMPKGYRYTSSFIHTDFCPQRSQEQICLPCFYLSFTCIYTSETWLAWSRQINHCPIFQDCLLQLSGMVPHVPRNEKGNIEAAVLIQYVIDYILDLSQQLGGQYPFCTRSSPLHCMGESREPLSEKTLENIVSCQVRQHGGVDRLETN